MTTAMEKNKQNKLIIQNLSKTYSGGLKALNNINLSLSNGLFGLLGPNGAGKSTLMRTLATLQEPSSGMIQFNGENIYNDPAVMRKNLGYLPQDFGVFQKATARRLLEYIAALKGLSVKGNAQIDQLLEVTNLKEHEHRRVITFSGGMLRRFGIAQALLGSPSVLIVDEPTAGLDPEERHRFQTMLCQVAQSMIVILSTHLVDDVRHLCSNLAVLKKGSIQFQGQPEELAQLLEDKVWTIDQDDFRPEDNPYVIPLTTRVRHGKRVVRVMSPQKPGAHFRPSQAQIEDGYFYVLQNQKVPSSQELKNA